MSLRWQRLRDLHKWPWWTALGSIVGILGAAIAVFAWLLPQSPETPGSPPSATVRTVSPSGASPLAVQVGSSGHWLPDETTVPSAVVQFEISYRNQSRQVQRNVVIHVDLPTGMTYLPGTSRLRNGTNPNGLGISDDLPIGGVNIGDYDPGAAAYVIFSASIDPSGDFACDSRTLAPQATMHTGAENAAAETIVHVVKRC
jgi:hypothetical protein